MNNLINMNFDGNDIRTVKIEEKVWFVASDVSKSLGYVKATNAIRSFVSKTNLVYLNWSEYHNTAIGNLWGKSDFNAKRLINQNGIYELLDHSHLPKAREFNYWVNNEVLPSINDNGVYATKSALDDWVDHPENLIAVLTKYKQKRDEADEAKKQLRISEKQNELMKPKEKFYDDVASSKSTILVGDMAKLLKQCGIDIGQRRLFVWLRNNHYLIKRQGKDRNAPTQSSLNMGIMRFKENTIELKSGYFMIVKTPLITGKGQQYFYDKFMNGGNK